MMVAVGGGLLIELNHVTKIQFEESSVVSVTGNRVSGATVYQLGPQVTKLSREQAQTLFSVLNQIGERTPQPGNVQGIEAPHIT